MCTSECEDHLESEKVPCECPAERKLTHSMVMTGKSTLSDCLLELTGNISTKEKQNKAQFTDTLKVRA